MLGLLLESRADNSFKENLPRTIRLFVDIPENQPLGIDV